MYFVHSESPKAVVILQPDEQTFRGETVTLRCQIQGERDTEWEYSWHKKSFSLSPVSEDQEYTISPVNESHSGEYTCRGKRRRDSQNSEISDAVTLTVSSALSPPASLITSTNTTQHFTSDSLSLSCEVQSNSIGWTVRRYTDNGEVPDCSSDWGSVTGSTCSISSLQSSDSGVYWCQSDSGGNSNPLNITVPDGDVILESPVHPVTEGDTFTLRCKYRNTSSDLRADFYKDGLVLQNQTTGEMTIPTLSKSDEGLYWCKHPERGESPKSWITVPATTAHVYDGGDGPGDVTFSQIEMKNIKIRNKDKTNTPQEDTVSSMLNSNTTTDSVAGPSNLTYAQVAVTSVKNKKKKRKGESSASTGTVYSELKSGCLPVWICFGSSLPSGGCKDTYSDSPNETVCLKKVTSKRLENSQVL
ncbi:Fc receptor-like protein 2 [Chanos chanos]|uniref:Fc receptor-like protein 2 n=1 Tax=Chanos chanos TaxID=29144 RepID=A0A6J2VVL7_CHACN|nr:Fc receptor-like protein 2 [Chanos chanos]